MKNKDKNVMLDIMFGVYTAISILVAVVSIICLNEAFALMSRKSDRDLFIGLLIVTVLIAFNLPFFKIMYRKLLLKRMPG